ncbi:MAG: mechanosensitive ion channel family protein [Rhodospirillaceae bacterium]|nr:mechanosensitive ion channel family protein [Rhodospirillaceae bacterium]MBT4488347.1 mechanosensitive ion channel family protein [Rhodospirillaceae bacterium]MBT5194924.1 mechanosensitive ion channel family protein [Rhodospirillaceae bacterium]MBT5896601.1 mechanosensitive ion channel family protein [Rhodospirillaceae bacterium]
MAGLWAEAVTVWQTAVLGVGVGQVLLALAVFIVFLILRRIFTRIVLAILGNITRRTVTQFDDELIAALEQPLRFVFIIVGIYAATQVVSFPEQIDVLLTRVVRSLIAFAIFWTLYRFVAPLSFLIDKAFGAFGRSTLGDSLKEFVAKLARFVIAVVGVVAILEEWQFNVGAVLGGLGLVGMAVAFGAQNMIANLFAGVTIFLDGIFEKGDWIRGGGVEGTVEEIGFRTTKIRRFDKALTTIPNDKLAGDAVINFSRMTNRRIYWKIGIEYSATEGQLRQIVNGIKAHIYDNDDFEVDAGKVTTLIHVDSFNDSSIDIMLYCFTATTNWGVWMRVKEDLAFAIKNIVEGAGSGFAFPSTSIYVETLPFGTPEVFPAGTD